MTLATLIRYNKLPHGWKIRAGINNVGISNFVTLLETTACYRRDGRRKKYGDERDPEMRAFLQKISPLTNAQRIRAALFVAHGVNDPRVPVSEADQIVTTVQKSLGRHKVWYMLAMNEGHGFQKGDNVQSYQDAMGQFWKEHLLGEARIVWGEGEANAKSAAHRAPDMRRKGKQSSFEEVQVEPIIIEPEVR